MDSTDRVAKYVFYINQFFFYLSLILVEFLSNSVLVREDDFHKKYDCFIKTDELSFVMKLLSLYFRLGST